MDAFKRVDAEELAGALGIEWDYESAEDDYLYTALNELGYEWGADGWAPIDG